MNAGVFEKSELLEKVVIDAIHFRARIEQAARDAGNVAGSL
jgi:hypothetical protein